MNPIVRFSIAEHVVAKKLGDELVLMDLASGTYFGLDEVGAHLWDGLGKGMTVGEIGNQLLSIYEIDKVTLARDLEDLVEDLCKRELIAPVAP